MTVITHITIEAKTKKENRKDMCEAVGKYAERKVETAREFTGDSKKFNEVYEMDVGEGYDSYADIG